MTDYLFPTVIPHIIPLTDMTPLERLVLTHMFRSEPEGDGLYLFSEEGPCDWIELPARRLKAAFDQSAGIKSRLWNYVAPQVSAPPRGAHIEIDLTGTSREFFLQDIVRRSRTLPYLTAVTAFTCTKMRPDGFGGAATFITANAIKTMSTHAYLEDRIRAFEARNKRARRKSAKTTRSP